MYIIKIEWKNLDNNIQFILAADKFVQETHLKQPGFSCSDCGSFTKNKERIEKFKHAEVQILFAKMNNCTI